MKHRILIGALCASTSLFAAAAAQSIEGTGEDVIVVTSQLRAQSVLEVPLAVTAYDDEFLSATDIEDFDDLSAFVPGFTVQEQSVNNPGFVLRGITSDDGAATIEPRVSVFQNGVSISRSRGSVVPLFDLERVEVLNGPQGTLFGRSAQIGAVQIITAKAEHSPSGAASIEAGNLGQIEAQGHLNVPIVQDILALRVAAFHEERDGYIDNSEGEDFNSIDTTALRASVLFEPTDALRFDLIANHVENSPSGISFKSGVIPALGGDTDPQTFASLNAFGDFLGGADLGVDRKLFDVTLITQAELSPAWSLTATAAYREFESLEVFDPDGTALSLLVFAEDAEGEQTSFDARFDYDAGGPFRALIGGGVFVEEGSQTVPLGFDLSGLQLFTTFGAVPRPLVPGDDVELPASVNPAILGALLTGDPAVFAPSGLSQTETVTNFADNTSFDLFGEVAFDVTPTLELIAGLRYTRDNKQTGFLAEVTDPNPTLLAIVGGSVPDPLSVLSVLGGVSDGRLSSDDQDGIDGEFDGFAWRAVANWEFQPGRYAYFSYARGRRPEVIEEDFSRDSSNADGDLFIGDVVGQFQVVPEETVDSFEIGLKGQFFDDRLTFQSAAYYYQYENFQTSVAVNEVGSAPEFDLINAGNADSYGIELQGQFEVTEGLSLFATYGWNRSRFEDEDSDGNPQQFAGNQFRLAPDHAFSLGADYEVNLGSGMTAFVTPTYTWQSEVFFGNDNDEEFNVINPTDGSVAFTVPAIKQEGYGLLNIQAGLTFKDGAYALEAYGRNVLDEEYILDAGNTGAVFRIPTYIAGPPATYGVRLRASF